MAENLSFQVAVYGTHGMKEVKKKIRTFEFIFQNDKLNDIKCLCFVRDRRMCSSLFSSAHDTPPEARIFWRES